MTTVRIFLSSEREPDIQAWLTAVQSAYDALAIVQRDVLGNDASRLTWVLSSADGAPMYIDLRAEPADGLPASLVETIATSFVRGVEIAAEHPGNRSRALSDAANDALRAVALVSGRGGLRGFATALVDDAAAGTAPAAFWLVQETTAGPDDDQSASGESLEGVGPAEYLGSLTGQIRILNLADRSDRFVWLNEEATSRRVKVRYGRELHDELVQAIEEHGRGMRRVTVTGSIATDANGNPASMTATDIEAIPLDEDLPSMSSVAGSLSGLAQGRSSADFIRSRRARSGNL